MNAYDVKAGIVFFAGQKLCDPFPSALEWFVPYKCSDLHLPYGLRTLGQHTVVASGSRGDSSAEMNGVDVEGFCCSRLSSICCSRLMS